MNAPIRACDRGLPPRTWQSSNCKAAQPISAAQQINPMVIEAIKMIRWIRILFDMADTRFRFGRLLARLRCCGYVNETRMTQSGPPKDSTTVRMVRCSGPQFEAA
jgi:hypothetical protein